MWICKIQPGGREKDVTLVKVKLAKQQCISSPAEGERLWRETLVLKERTAKGELSVQRSFEGVEIVAAGEKRCLPCQ